MPRQPIQPPAGRQPAPASTDRADRQPHARIDFTEYELQVLESLLQYAIDEGVVRADMIDCCAAVQRKVQTGRSDLAIARRRLAVQQSNARAKAAEDDDAAQED